MDGVILAAGPGTRLRPLTNAVPKALVTVGPYPLAEHVLRGFVSAGVDNVIFVTGHLARKVESYFAEGERWEISSDFVRQPAQRGTADAVAAAESLVNTNPFFLAYGDIFILDARNYVDFLEFHLNGGFEFSIMCNTIDDPWEGAAVTLDGDRVTSIVEKPPRGTSASRLNKRGVYLLTHRIFDYLADLKTGVGDEFVFTDALVAALADGVSVGGFVVRGYSSDVGTMDRLEDARRQWESRPSDKA